MRPQQQNRRMRGRGNNNNNNNNRKGPNPLTRSYESNGPDVKIRGTAQQIADKYATLARDAHSSGDRVMSENYLQHAEHYNRIIAAAQAQLQPQQNMRDNREDSDEDGDEREDQDERDEREFTRPNIQQQQRPRIDDGSGPQPVIQGLPAEVALNERQGARTNGGRSNGHDRQANGEAEAANPAEPAEEQQAVAAEPIEPAAKPARRPRRPRAKKTEEDTPAAEVPAAE